jgi:hypothetical protein
MKKAQSYLQTILLCLCLSVHAYADELNYNDFSTTDGLVLDGDAYKTGSIIRLTDAEAWSMGSAFSADPLTIETFNAHFTFQFTGYGHEYGSADGIVFVIKSAYSGDGFNGGSMGYRGIENSIGVEFDNWYNPEYGDPAHLHNHIAFDTNGSVNSIAIKDLYPAEFNGTGTWHAWVDYNGMTLSASVNRSGIKPAVPMLSAIIDIPNIVGSAEGIVGFTAATGAAYQNHDLLSLYYAPIETGGFGEEPVPEPSTLLLTGVGLSLAAWQRKKNRVTETTA